MTMTPSVAAAPRPWGIDAGRRSPRSITARRRRIKSAAILVSHYGQAAAIDVYGKADGLPPALSGHNQYWLWGPRGYDGSLIIIVGSDPERWRRGCGSLDIVDKTDSPFAMPYENGRPIFICRNSRLPLAKLWDRLKRYR